MTMDSFDEFMETVDPFVTFTLNAPAQGYTRRDMRRAFKAGQQLPSEHVAIPREPTEKMLEAAQEATQLYYIRPCPPNEYNTAVWKAMLEARQ